MKNVPPLWPGFDPDADNRTAAAWRDLWKTCASSAPEGLVVVGLAERHPGLKVKTLRGIIAKAIRNGHLERTRTGRIRRTTGGAK